MFGMQVNAVWINFNGTIPATAIGASIFAYDMQVFFHKLTSISLYEEKEEILVESLLASDLAQRLLKVCRRHEEAIQLLRKKGVYLSLPLVFYESQPKN